MTGRMPTLGMSPTKRLNGFFIFIISGILVCVNLIFVIGRAATQNNLDHTHMLVFLHDIIWQDVQHRNLLSKVSKSN